MTFVIQPHSGAIHLFLMQYMTDRTLHALLLLMPPAAGAAARKQTPYCSILDEKNYIARKILLALWYLYVIFSSELRRFRLHAIWDLSKAARLPMPVEEPTLAAGCIIPESLGIGRTSDEFDARIAHRGACGGGEIGLR
ncbi:MULTISPECIES: hypothetical protein [Rhizobium]|uniref:hypothetical protein n=1 Tax=Rhizobium TaxID=379 RepID=UPI0015BF4A1E|nr:MULTISPECIES: hypothetical protein [Rhizobium]KAF5881187.1 hypothetical protein FY112_31040 [Rhizobium sp. PEPV16]MBY5778580.1 hypothetical protein [Rhizobium leguminosarum]